MLCEKEEGMKFWSEDTDTTTWMVYLIFKAKGERVCSILFKSYQKIVAR